MMTAKQMGIFQVFCRKPFGEFTIKQIKHLAQERSNNALEIAMTRFKEEKLLREKRVGRSALYTLDLDNDLVYYYLALANHQRLGRGAHRTLSILKEKLRRRTQFMALAVFGLKSGIDFSAGSLLTVAFDTTPPLADLKTEITTLGYSNAIVQETGNEDFIIRLGELTDAEKNSLEDGLETAFGPLTEQGFESVDPIIARQTLRIAMIAVGLAAVGILLYLTYAFRRMPKPLHYGTGAVVALLHDVVVVLGIFAALAAVFGWEVDLVFIIGILAILGYSVNNTVVIYDRIRENAARGAAPTFEGVVNRSVAETLIRSVNTSFTTIIAVLTLMLFVGATIQNLAVVMLIGIIVGTYDSLFVSPAILVIWDNFDKRRLAPRVSRAGA